MKVVFRNVLVLLGIGTVLNGEPGGVVVLIILYWILAPLLA